MNEDEYGQSEFETFQNFDVSPADTIRYDTDSYGLCGCDTDQLRIGPINTDGPSVASAESVYVCD